MAKLKVDDPIALRQRAEVKAKELERDVERLTAQAESDEQKLVAANEEIAALRLELEETRPSKKAPGSAASRKRSASPSTATKSAGSAGTRGGGRSSSRGSSGATSKSP